MIEYYIYIHTHGSAILHPRCRLGFYTQPASQPSYIPTRPDLKCHLPPRASRARFDRRAWAASAQEGGERWARDVSRLHQRRIAAACRRTKGVEARWGLHRPRGSRPAAARRRARRSARTGRAEGLDRRGGSGGLQRWQVSSTVLTFFPLFSSPSTGAKQKKFNRCAPILNLSVQIPNFFAQELNLYLPDFIFPCRSSWYNLQAWCVLFSRLPCPCRQSVRSKYLWRSSSCWLLH